jgi:hypothetical protein
MSNSAAIAAVTASIRNLLFTGVSAAVPGAVISTRPPDKVRPDSQGNFVNVFLYQTSVDAAWRNQNLPEQTRPGEDGRPPLPLSLYYLVTAYGDNDDEIVSHRMLGRAMGVLHDHPVLDRAEIAAALPESDLGDQVERVRITLQPMSVEEMSKLWTTFQTQYRISAAYQACVVLIESTLSGRAPVPVLGRGDANDTGPVAQGSVDSPLPAIDSILPPESQPSAVLGDEVVLAGRNLGGVTSVRLVHLRTGVSVDVPPPPLDAVSSESVTFHVPDEPTDLPAGTCSVTGVIAVAGQPDALTNVGPLQVAPKVVNAVPVRDAAGVTVTVTCSPKVVPGQTVQLILGDRQVPLGPVAGATDTLEFAAGDLAAGDYLLRLRVDGIDSRFIDRTATPPTFDPTQIVAIP